MKWLVKCLFSVAHKPANKGTVLVQFNQPVEEAVSPRAATSSVHGGTVNYVDPIHETIHE
jgi:hypothetical protein